MTEREYYVICNNNCRFPSMTKEQILTAIEQAISGGEIKDVDSGFITTIKEQNANSGLKFWVGTSAQYNAIEEKQSNVLYLLTDETTEEDINAALQQLATDIQNAGEEITVINTEINSIKEDIKALENIIGKATLIFDCTQNDKGILYEGNTAPALTNEKFLMYYITVDGSSTGIIASGVYYTDGTNKGWAIRGSGALQGATAIQELFASLTHIGDNLNLQSIVLRAQNILTDEFTYTEGQGIARIYGIGKA